MVMTRVPFLPAALPARPPCGLAGLPRSTRTLHPPSFAAPTASDLWRRQSSRPWALQVHGYVSAQAAWLPCHRPTGVGTPLSPLRSESETSSMEISILKSAHLVRWCVRLKALLLVFAVSASCLAPKAPPSLSVDTRLPAARAIAEAFDASVTLSQGNDDVPAVISIDLGVLGQAVDSVIYDRGVIKLKKEGSSYNLFLCMMAESMSCSLVEGKLLRLIIPPPKPPSKQKNEEVVITETGKYPVIMVEEHYLGWIWELVPAFPDAPPPTEMGVLVSPTERDLLRETRKKFK